MLTTSVIYVFYASLGGIIVLLSYKIFMMGKGHHIKKSDFDDREFFSDVCWQTSKKVHTVMFFTKKTIVSPLCVFVTRNVKLTCRGGARFMKDMQSIREKPGTMIENNGAASTYLKKILAQKKLIQKKNNKVFHSENL